MASVSTLITPSFFSFKKPNRKPFFSQCQVGIRPVSLPSLAIRVGHKKHFIINASKLNDNANANDDEHSTRSKKEEEMSDNPQGIKGETEAVSDNKQHMTHLTTIIAVITSIYSIVITLFLIFRPRFAFVTFPLKQRKPKLTVRTIPFRSIFKISTGATRSPSFVSTSTNTTNTKGLSYILAPIMTLIDAKLAPINKIKKNLITIRDGIYYVIEFYVLQPCISFFTSLPQ